MYPGLPQLPKMKSFAVIINGFQSSTIIANFSVLDVCMHGSWIRLWEITFRVKSYLDIFFVKHFIFNKAVIYRLEACNFVRRFFEKISRRKFPNNLKRAIAYSPCRETSAVEPLLMKFQG